MHVCVCVRVRVRVRVRVQWVCMCSGCACAYACGCACICVSPCMQVCMCVYTYNMCVELVVCATKHIFNVSTYCHTVYINSPLPMYVASDKHTSTAANLGLLFAHTVMEYTQKKNTMPVVQDLYTVCSSYLYNKPV